MKVTRVTRPSHGIASSVHCWLTQAGARGQARSGLVLLALESVPVAGPLGRGVCRARRGRGCGRGCTWPRRGREGGRHAQVLRRCASAAGQVRRATLGVLWRLEVAHLLGTLVVRAARRASEPVAATALGICAVAALGWGWGRGGWDHPALGNAVSRSRRAERIQRALAGLSVAAVERRRRRLSSTSAQIRVPRGDHLARVARLGAVASAFGLCRCHRHAGMPVKRERVDTSTARVHRGASDCISRSPRAEAQGGCEDNLGDRGHGVGLVVWG
jgi:hypothetical protein